MSGRSCQNCGAPAHVRAVTDQGFWGWLPSNLCDSCAALFAAEGRLIRPRPIGLWPWAYTVVTGGLLSATKRDML